MAHRSFAAAWVATMVVAVVAAGSPLAHGDDTEYRDPGYGMGYGMDPGGMDEYCPACGMMGGRGGDHGVTGGYGMGPGMMGGGPMAGLDLDVEQRRQIARIRSELRKQNWALQGEIIDAQETLFELYADETPDAKKIGAAYGKIFDIRRQMIEAAINAQNRQRAVLTQEQREQLRIGPNGWRNGDYDPGVGRMGHQHGRHMMGG